MLYHLTLGRAGDFVGFQFWAAGGLHGSALANGFVQSPEFVQLRRMDDNAFINLLYLNTVHQAPGAISWRSGTLTWIATAAPTWWPAGRRRHAGRQPVRRQWPESDR
jgi:hypothetical protein